MGMLCDEDIQKLYIRLFLSEMDMASASFALEMLVKKGWHLQPQQRRGRSSEQHQVIYVSALLIAYGRPFIPSSDWPRFPEDLMPFTPEECGFHEQMIRMRNRVVIHSSDSAYSIRTRRVQEFLQSVASVQYPVISAAEAALLRGMVWKLRSAIHQRLREMLL